MPNRERKDSYKGAVRLEFIRKQCAVGEADNPGSWEFSSYRDPSKVYRVTYGRAGQLECTCEGFHYRGNCKHVQEVRAQV